MPHRLAQQWMTVSDLERPFPHCALTSAVDELFGFYLLSVFDAVRYNKLAILSVLIASKILRRV